MSIEIQGTCIELMIDHLVNSENSQGERIPITFHIIYECVIPMCSEKFIGNSQVEKNEFYSDFTCVTDPIFLVANLHTFVKPFHYE